MKFGQPTITRYGMPTTGLAVMVFIGRKVERISENRMLISLKEHKGYAFSFFAKGIL